MSDPAICPICKNPKKSGSSGSLTQWIAACTCDVAPPPLDEAAQAISVKLCKTCGKRINEGRSGSLTQFIFRSDVCQCARPEIPEELKVDPVEAQELTQPLEEETEVELEESIEGFPYERYKPLERLGMGTGGSVFLARDKMLNKKVAVKMLRSLVPSQLISFHEEARATSKLEHPCIVKLLDFGASDSGIPYMVLEYIQGESLESKLEKSGRLDIKSVQAIFKDILEGISYAHANGIFHRDIKPSNILLTEGPENISEVKIIDFGIAKAFNVEADSDSQKETDFNTPVGAPFYMSPDQGLGKPYDSRSEIYSLGCVLFECLAGRPPFEGETPLSTLAMHAIESPPSLKGYMGDSFVPDLDQVVHKALAKEQEDRYQNAIEFRSALLEIEDLALAETLSRTDFHHLKGKSKKSLATLVFLISVLIIVPTGLYFYLNHVARKNAVSIPTDFEEKTTYKSLPAGKDVDHVLGDELKLDDKSWEMGRGGRSAIGRNISDEDLKDLENYPQLRFLKTIPPAKIQGWGLKYVPENTISICIASEIFDEDGARELTRFKKLDQAKIHSSKKLTDKAVEYILSSPVLTAVELRYIHPLPPNAVKMVAHKNGLTAVDIGHSEPITRDDIAELSKSKTITYLRLSNSEVDDTYVPYLLKMPLERLDINDSKISDKGLMELTKLKNLKLLKVALVDNQLTYPGTQDFARHRPDVKMDIINFFGIKDDGLDSEAQLDNLIEDVSKRMKKIKR
ncbi:MAG: serine/threonine-protein kinase [Cyanobacteriota/Melainabacteria group bacterium]